MNRLTGTAKTKKSRMFFIRLLLSTVSAVLIPILLFSTISSTKDNELLEYAISTEAGNVALNIGNQFEAALNATLSWMTSMRQIVASNNRETLLVSDEMTFIKSLRYSRYSLPFIENLGFYIPEPNALYMNNAKYDIDIYARSILRLDNDTLQGYLSSGKPGFYTLPRNSIMSCLYVYPIDLISQPHTSGWLLCTFSSYSVTTYLQSFIPANYQLLSICAPNGESIYSNPYSPLIADNASNGMRISYNGETYIIGHSVNTNGYTVSVMVELNSMTFASIQYSPIVRSLYVITGLCCLILLAVILALNYMPFHRTIKTIAQKYPLDKNDGDELSQISGAFERQIDESVRLRATLSEQRLLLVDYTYERLILGGMVPKQSIDILRQQMPAYIVVCARSADVRSTDVLIEANRSAASIYTYDHYIADQIVLVCRIDNRYRIETIIRSARAVLGEVPVGISNVCEDISLLHDMYLEADSMLNHQFSENDPSPAVYTETEIDVKIHQLENEINNYLDSNYLDPNFSITSIADHMHLSEYTVGKLLKQLYGENFRHTINVKRLEYAKQLLLTTDKTVNTIGQESGFSSSSYFIKVFRDYEKLTPAKYRELAILNEE